MANSKDVVEGIQILQKYTQDSYFLAAEHDVLYVQVEHDSVPPEDQEKLEKLGFRKDESGGWAVFV